MKKTTLILGAGASYPYRFPSSRELSEIIIDSNTAELAKIRSRLGHEIRWLDAARSASDSNYAYPTFASFQKTFADSAAHSIDLFAQVRARDYEKYQAQTAVASIFLCCETDAAVQANDWYRDLWNEILRHGGRDFPLGKLSVVTFNYERSLEYYLAHRAKAAFGLSTENSYEWLSRISVDHVYGKLGCLNRSAGDRFLPWGNMHGDNVWKAAGDLRLADTREDAVKAEWTASLREAENIFFLGFGFWPENLALLRDFIVPSALVRASALGLSDKDRARASKQIPSIQWGESQWTAADCFLNWDLF